MSNLTKQDIIKIAKLSRIEITEAETEKYQNELNKIFSFIEQLNELNVDGVPAMAGVGGYTLRTRDADEVTDGGIQKQVVANAPKSQFGCFVVPKVVDAG